MAEAAAQRRWRAACPNCGAPVEFASAASTTAVCSFCRSTLLRERGAEGDALLRIGQSAEIFDDYSPLQLGATGRWMGQGFSVVGRVQRGAAQGNWNEWHLLFDADVDSPRIAWLSEDNGRFVLSLEAPLDDTPPEQPVVGAPLTLAGQRWQVAAVVDAQLRAAEGELPRPPQPGRVVELRNAQDEVGTLEYGDAHAPLWAIGRAVALPDLALQGLRTTAEGESVAEARFAGRSFACPNCGAPLQPQLAQTRSLVCGQCQALVELPEGDAKALAFTAQSPGAPPLLALGSTGTLAVDGAAPAPWQIVGYQERCDLPEDADDDPSVWREYLLFNRLAGFAFLVDTDEGWSLVRTLTGAPAGGAGRAPVNWQGRSYAHRWSYAAKTTRVLGEFYWPVRVGDVVQVADYATSDGRQLLSREQDGNEITWSGGQTLAAAAVQQAFGLPVTAAFPRDASAYKSGGSLLRNIIVAIFLVAVLGALMRACSDDDCQAYKDSFGASSPEYSQCLAASRGSGVYIPRGSGGSYGGYSSGGGSHK